MHIQGPAETLPRRAPTAAINMLAAMSHLGPNLSETMPLGMLRRNWQRMGIATMSPICARTIISIDSGLCRRTPWPRQPFLFSGRDPRL